MRRNIVLVIAAHPDDEVLGVGGTLIKHIRNKDNVFCLILGEGVTSRKEYDEKRLESLHSECKKAGKIIGFKKIFLSKLPDNKFDSVPLLNIIKEIEGYIKKIKPDIVYTHHGGDVNIDHRITYKAVMTACRPCNSDCPKEIYSFETLSSTEWQLDNKKIFVPNIYINIEKEIDKKIKAMKEYKSEIRNYPHPRSEKGISTLASFRGLQANLRYAEAFRLERKIE